MSKLFKQLPFPVKLSLVGLVPLAFLLFFAIQIIKERKERIYIVQNVLKQTEAALTTAELANQIQEERKTTFNYFLFRASEAELATQRARTDEKLREFDLGLGSDAAGIKGYTLLEELPQQRALITRRQMSAEQALSYYTVTLNRLHSSTSVSLNGIPYLQTISKELTGQRIMAQLANYFGFLRAQIFYQLYYKRPSSENLDAIFRNTSLVFSYWGEYQIKAPASSINAFKALEKSPQSQFLNKVLFQIRQSNRLDSSIPAEDWWNNAEYVLENIKRIQLGLMKQTSDIAKQIAAHEKDELQKVYISLLVIILIVIAIVVATILSISNTLRDIKLAAEKLALGNTGIQLPASSNDAIGSLAKSISILDKNNVSLAKAADAIGRGNFEVDIKPRSEEDLLGNAILRMKADLQHFSKENTEKLWIQNGLTAINDALRGEKSVNDLSDQVLDELVCYLDGQVGVLYTCDDDRLKFSAGYALSDQYPIPKTIAFGETLLGEAAKRKEIIYLPEVPDEFIRVSTASGEAIPRHVVIVPLTHNHLIEGVIEIASFKPFAESARALLEQSATHIAIAMQAAKSREKLQSLLEETQAQSEELQAQHAELEGLNTELEAQAQKLQSSEEELKVQQEELLQANQELEERSRSLEEKNQLIVERNLDIQKKAEELELTTRYKSEFLANMSHELRTPLNSILLLSRLMYENPENNLTDDQVEYAQVIQSSGNGLLALIDEILDLSKIESGKMDLEYEEVFLRDIVADMRALFSPIARDKNLDFNIVLDSSTPTRISTDKMRVEQIVKNLLSNALKFTPRGSVDLIIEPSNDVEFIKITVRDSGIGIPKEKQQHVFEAFKQADGSTRRKFGGTGLGLSISRELAKILGGNILLNSEEGKGSEFTLLLPVYKIQRQPEKTETAESVVEEATPQKNDSQNEQRSRHIVPAVPQEIPDDREVLTDQDRVILIVEDDTAFAKALLEYTRKAGYKGLVAVRGDSGIEMARQYNPMAILLDIQLPVKDGWEVMEELKSNPATRHIPVHIMSSLKVRKESLLKGAVDFIDKPVALEQMRLMFEKLEDALNRHPKKVLIIEENPQHAKALAYFLSTFNVTSEIRGTVSEGISTLKNAEADCVILDMGLPANNAYETLDSIKKNPGLENLPIIIFTGKNLSTAEENRLKYYADSIVMKTAHSYQRILDEVALFLHLVEEKKKPREEVKRKNVLDLNEILQNKTVLIADDDVRNIFSLTKALEQLKMKVISATDGREAVKVLEENPQTDVILMDMMMPEMDGYESTQEIRKNPKFKTIPILAVTAKAMVGDREKCIKAGASDYISKPVDIDQLISLLRVWLYDKAV